MRVMLIVIDRAFRIIWQELIRLHLVPFLNLNLALKRRLMLINIVFLIFRGFGNFRSLRSGFSLTGIRTEHTAALRDAVLHQLVQNVISGSHT